VGGHRLLDDDPGRVAGPGCNADAVGIDGRCVRGTTELFLDFVARHRIHELDGVEEPAGRHLRRLERGHDVQSRQLAPVPAGDLAGVGQRANRQLAQVDRTEDAGDGGGLRQFTR